MVCRKGGLVCYERRIGHQNQKLGLLPRQVSRRQPRNDPQHAIVDTRLHEVDRNHSRRWDTEDAVQTQVEHGGVKRKGHGCGRRVGSGLSLLLLLVLGSFVDHQFFFWDAIIHELGFLQGELTEVTRVVEARADK